MNRLIAIFLLLLSMPAGAKQVDVRGARIWAAPDQTRLVVDVAASVEHRIFSLENPDRLVIDIPDARLKAKLPAPNADDPMIGGLRSGVRKGDDLRLVLDLRQRVRAKSFLLKPNKRYGHRLVVDLAPQASRAKKGGGQGHLSVRQKPKKARDVIVAIDAGHGGEDPGAVGASGTREKDITLAISRKLAKLIRKEPGMQPLMIRGGDYYVGLYKRIRIARKQRADLFVSIHADAFRDKSVRGSSVYTLSQKGATSKAAKWLADKENSADQIGGIALDDKDDDLTKTLWDMVQNATMEHSRIVAKSVLVNLGDVGKVHNRKVQQARFAVLKAPDIPSLLVETAFISNPEEEKRLRSSRHQARIAKAILAGIKAYFAKNPPPDTYLAAQRQPRHYKIASGDTLLEIALRHDVSLTSLRKANQIDGDRIRVGQVLTIPEG